MGSPKTPEKSGDLQPRNTQAVERVSVSHPIKLVAGIFALALLTVAICPAQETEAPATIQAVPTVASVTAPETNTVAVPTLETNVQAQAAAEITPTEPSPATSGTTHAAPHLAPVVAPATPDPYTSEFERSPQVNFYQQQKLQEKAREQQEQFRKLVSIEDAVGDDVPTSEAINQARVEKEAAFEKKVAASYSGIRQTNIIVFIGSVLTVILIVKKLAPGLFDGIVDYFKSLIPSSTHTPVEPSAKVRAEEDAISDFLASFQTGPGESSANNEVLDGFFTKAANTLGRLQQLVETVTRTTDEAGRHKALVSMRWEMHALKDDAGLPQLLPVWQMAFTLEGLIKQLADNSSNINPSTLRTVAGGVELLGILCQPGLAPDLLTRHPLRILEVDDDPISRKAVCLALKRALNQPDVAENGNTALALTSKLAYDVIFLDVQMPGIDGFELCTRIHNSPLNRNTPVVFVTGQSDFEARIQSTLSGGSDLIGKPFLTFEITTKALTFALRGRLGAVAQPVTKPAEITVPQESADNVPALQEQPADSALVPQEVTPVEPETFIDSVQSSESFAQPRSLAEAGIASDPSPEEVATEFLTRASSQLDPLREQFNSLLQTSDKAVWQEKLADAYLRIHSFTPNADRGMHPAIHLSAALQGLIKKLLAKQENCTVSALVTIATGVDLLSDLCVSGLDPNLVTHPPIRMLVVDDDPVTRRAMVCSLQMAFEKPDSAATGTAALTLTTDKPYDVIFLDVQMPGMDGFNVCSKIRNTTTNRTTPVVFVTGQNDFDTRNQMSQSGGNDFVEKPFLTSEITVKALTFALRSRLDKIETANS